MVVFTENLKKQGYLESLEMTLGIVGSRKMRSDDNYGSGDWQIFAPNLTIYGFDADADACLANNLELEERNVNWKERHIPLAISDESGTSTLYVTRGVDCSSLYPPNEDYLRRFHALNEHIKLDFSVDIETTTLDDFCDSEKIQNMHFINLDIQGAELKVLKGAEKLCDRGVMAIQLEVEFSPMYCDQPLFSDVDSYLRSRGFTLFDLMTDHPMCRRPRSVSPIYSQRRIGQLLWADALYFRDPISDRDRTVNQDPKNILALACIADILDYPDYALELLLFLTENYGKNPDYQLTDCINETVRSSTVNF